jgi:hypothetical protein
MTDNPTPLTWLQELYRQSPILALLVAIIVTGYLQFWIWGSNYREMRDERDEYRKLAFDELHQLEAAASRQRADWANRYHPTPSPSPITPSEVAPLKRQLETLESKKKP